MVTREIKLCHSRKYKKNVDRHENIHSHTHTHNTKLQRLHLSESQPGSLTWQSRVVFPLQCKAGIAYSCVTGVWYCDLRKKTPPFVEHITSFNFALQFLHRCMPTAYEIGLSSLSELLRLTIRNVQLLWLLSSFSCCPRQFIVEISTQFDHQMPC